MVASFSLFFTMSLVLLFCVCVRVVLSCLLSSDSFQRCYDLALIRVTSQFTVLLCYCFLLFLVISDSYVYCLNELQCFLFLLGFDLLSLFYKLFECFIRFTCLNRIAWRRKKKTKEKRFSLGRFSYFFSRSSTLIYLLLTSDDSILCFFFFSILHLILMSISNRWQFVSFIFLFPI